MGSKRRNVNNQQQKEEYDRDPRNDAYDGPADGGSFQVASQDKRAKRRIVSVSSRGRFKNMAATVTAAKAESKTIPTASSSPSRNTNPFGSIVMTPSAATIAQSSVSDDPPPPPNPFSNVSFASAQPPATGLGFSFGKKQDTKATPAHIKRKSVVFNSPVISDSEEATARHQAQIFLETILIGHSLQRPSIVETACHGLLERAAQRRRRSSPASILTPHKATLSVTPKKSNSGSDGKFGGPTVAALKPAGGFSFGAPAASSPAASKPAGSSFGAASASPATSKPSGGFSFGAATASSPAAKPSGGFSFGGAASPAAKPSGGFSFGGSSASSPATSKPAGGFSFGGAASPPVKAPSPATKPTGGFSFGGAASATPTPALPTPASIPPAAVIAADDEAPPQEEETAVGAELNNTTDDILLTVRAKCFTYELSTKKWKAGNTGPLRLYQSKDVSDNRKKIVHRNGVGKVMLNVAIVPGMKFKETIDAKKNMTAIQFKGVADETKGGEIFMFKVKRDGEGKHLYAKLLEMAK